MKLLLLTIAIIWSFQAFAQPNCEAYKYNGDTLKYRACKVAERRAGHYQFSRAYQEALDDALAIDSTFAYAYRAKSTAYLKSGDFITWMELMNKAVKFDPKGQLFYRGWCRYQFFNDYEGAIKDIELLDSMVEHDIGYSQNGDYHLHVARAICYKAIGQPKKAINIIEEYLKTVDGFIGIYDYLHLGVLYLEQGNYKNAIEKLNRQAQENDLAENRYYIALAYKELGMTGEYLENLSLAKTKYKSGMSMFDPYVEQMDKIYLADIEKEIETAKSNGFDLEGD